MTTYGPFAETTPRSQTGWIDDRRRPLRDHLRLMLGHLDGVQRYTYSIWRASDPQSIVVTPRDGTEAFIQAAGSAEAATVEVRLVDSDGAGHLYTVGRDETADGPSALVPINDTRAVRVSSNEVFTAEEAAAIFHAFSLTETISAPYRLRELDLSQDLSEPR